MKFHIAKKHSTATAKTFHKCNVCGEDFHDFHLWRERVDGWEHQDDKVLLLLK